MDQIKPQDIYARSVQHILQYMSSNTTKQSQELNVNQLYLQQKKIVCQVISQDRHQFLVVLLGWVH